MKIINFKNGYKEFIKTLIPENFKRDKSVLAKFIPKREGEYFKDVINCNFNDTDLAMFSVYNTNLLVFDCDNVYSADTFINFIDSPTLITRSPYGAHTYFYFNEETEEEIRELRSLIPSNYLPVSNDKVKESLESKQLKVEVFSPFYNNKKIIFDGNNNPYYKRVSSISEPKYISLEEIKRVKELFNSKEATSIVDFSKKVIISPNKEKYDFLKSCIECEKIDLYEFQLYYCSNEFSKKMSIIEGKQNRNNYLNSVWSSFASIGYLESEEELTEFILLVASQVLEIDLNKKEEGSHYNNFKEEILNTVCRKNRFKEGGYLNINDLEKFEKKLQRQKKESIDPFMCPTFIAQNYNMSSSSNQFLFIDFSNLKRPIIEKLCNGAAREIRIRVYPQLYNQHMRTVIDENGKSKVIFKSSTCPLVDIQHYEDNYTDLFIKKDGYFIINLNYFSYNSNINKVLTEDWNLPKEKIIEDFKKTRWAQIVERNHLYDENIRRTFYANIKDYLLTRSYRDNMLILKDAVGSTGKDSIITPHLEQLFFGDEVVFCANSEVSYVPSYLQNSVTISAREILEDQFNSFVTSPLIVINEDGGSINNFRLNTTLQNFLKNEKVSLREMHKSRVRINNRSFYIRYTNNTKQLISDSETNTRFYIANSRQDVTLEEWKEIFKNYEHLSPVEAGRQIAKEDEIALLRYFLLIPNNTDPRKLPEEATYIDNCHEGIEEVEDLKNINNFESPSDYVLSLFRYVIKGNYTFDLNKLQELAILDKKSLGYLLYRILATLYSKASGDFDYKGCIACEETILAGNTKIEIHRNKITRRTLSKIFRGYGYGKVPDFLFDFITQKFTNGAVYGSTKLIYKGAINDN